MVLLLHVVWVYLSKQELYSYEIENAKKRYSREANTPLTIVKQKLFERKIAKKGSSRTIKTSQKFK